jgi:hypothetical protein
VRTTAQMSSRAALTAIVTAVLPAMAGCGGSTAAVRPPIPRAASGSHAVAAGGSVTPGRSGTASVTAPAVHVAAAVAGRLPAPVQDPATTALGSRILLAGGLSAADTSVAQVLLVDGGRARAAAALPTAIHDAAAATLGGRAFVFGGGEPSHDQITPIGPDGARVAAGRLPAAASDVAAAALGGAVYVVGGYTGSTPLDTIVAWRGHGAGRVVGRLPRPVRYAAVAAAGGRLIIAGGTVDGAASRAVYAFDPGSGRVVRLATLPRPLTHAAAAALRGIVYLIGGRGSVQGTQTRRVLAIDPASGRVLPAGSLPLALSDAGAAATGDAIIVAGGRLGGGSVSDRILRLAVVGA